VAHGEPAVGERAAENATPFSEGRLPVKLAPDVAPGLQRLLVLPAFPGLARRGLNDGARFAGFGVFPVIRLTSMPPAKGEVCPPVKPRISPAAAWRRLPSREVCDPEGTTGVRRQAPRVRN
jgi:hypothetical protein